MRSRTERMKQRASSKRKLTLAIAVVLLLCCAVAGTLMYLIDKTNDVTNTFTAAKVTTKVNENFDGTVKKNVTAKNTGDIDAYIRIKLVTYRVNKDGDNIGGEATIPNFDPGSGWVKNSQGGFYYYTKPVKPDENPKTDLIGDSGITLQEYNDTDGGKQVVEVIAEAIQAQPADAVYDAWGVTVSNGTLNVQ